MAKSKSIEMSLPSADDLFTTQQERDEAAQEKVTEIDISEISDFPNHPFKVRRDQEMQDMAESIKKYGVLVPALVRPKEGGGYEMVAGHRRKLGSLLAEKDKLPCIVRDLTDDEATIIMVDSNLQREKILPSEKAFAYKMKLEAMKRQAGRPKKNSVPLAQNFNGKTSRELLGEQVGESQDQIRRYIRLTELIPEILNKVDEEKIALRPAVELSYLPKELQQELYETMEAEDCTPSHVQAVKMRKMHQEDKLTVEVIYSIMQEQKPNQQEKIVLRDWRIKKLLPKGLPVTRREEYVIKALEYYGKYRQKQKQQQER